MLQTNLIGETVQVRISRTKHTVVAVYVAAGNLIIVGSDEEGNLHQFSIGQVQLIETPRGPDKNLEAPWAENLNGVI